MGAPTTADAALDRLLARLYRIELAGESMRRPERDKTADAGPSTANGAGQGR